MDIIFSRSSVIKSYDRKIKLRKDGSIEVKIYDDSISYIDNNYEKHDTLFFDTLDTWGQVEHRKEILNKKELSIIDNTKSLNKSIHNDNELHSIRSDNLSRSRQTLIDYACENADKFHSFITLTFGENISDVTNANKCFITWRKQITRYCKDNGKEFYYLGVPEFQKSGRVHYHILTSLKHNEDIIKRESIKTYNKNKNKYYNIEYYDIKYWKYGYSSSFDIDKETDNKFNIALYIIKYLYKDIDKRLYGRKKILKSNNLEKPNVYKLSKDDIVWKCAYNYILNNKKSEIQKIDRIERTIDKPYLKEQNIIHLRLQDDNNMLLDILQDKDMEF